MRSASACFVAVLCAVPAGAWAQSSDGPPNGPPPNASPDTPPPSNPGPPPGNSGPGPDQSAGAQPAPPSGGSTGGNTGSAEIAQPPPSGASTGANSGTGPDNGPPAGNPDQSGPGNTAAPAPSAAASTPAQPPPEPARSYGFFYIQAEGGLSYLDLTGLQSNGHVLPAIAELHTTGYGGGARVGFRAKYIAVGATGYITRFDQSNMISGMSGFDIGQVMAEVQLHLPIGFVDPYISAGLGYAWLGEFQLNTEYAMSTSNIDGWTAKVGIGLDLWIGQLFTIGAGVDATAVNLRRGGVMRSGGACPDTDPTCVELSMDGDSIGTLLIFHLQAALHL